MPPDGPAGTHRPYSPVSVRPGLLLALSNVAQNWLVKLVKKLVSTASFEEKTLFCKKYIPAYCFSSQCTKYRRDPEMSYELVSQQRRPCGMTCLWVFRELTLREVSDRCGPPSPTLPLSGDQHGRNCQLSPPTPRGEGPEAVPQTAACSSPRERVCESWHSRLPYERVVRSRPSPYQPAACSCPALRP